MGASHLGQILSIVSCAAALCLGGNRSVGGDMTQIAKGVSWDFGCVEGDSNVGRLCFVQLNIFQEIKTELLRQVADILQQTTKIRVAVGQTASLRVALNSSGGDVDTALAVGRLLRKEAAEVGISPDHECASACIFLLIAGSERYVEGRVAMHRPYLVGGDGTLERVAASRRAIAAKLSAYATEMNVPPRL